jgi:hypothetical protein
MMSASSIGAGRGGGYARYLEGKTVAPERGDYYLTPGGELAEAPGRWLSDPETLARLGVDPTAPVDGGDFIGLMDGRHPETGAWLRRAGADGSRGGGIDVTFSAPKSVSVVWALGDPWQREQIEAAHARAVERSVGYLREWVPIVRRRYGAEVVEEPARDLIAAAYRHTTARGVSGADRPLRFIVMEPAIAPEMVAVIPRPEHTVRIVFADGEVRDVDITPLLDTPAFSALRDPATFSQVKVDEETGTIMWPGDVDLDPDVIYAALDLGPNKARIRVLTPSVAA